MIKLKALAVLGVALVLAGSLLAVCGSSAAPSPAADTSVSHMEAKADEPIVVDNMDGGARLRGLLCFALRAPAPPSPCVAVSFMRACACASAAIGVWPAPPLRSHTPPPPVVHAWARASRNRIDSTREVVAAVVAGKLVVQDYVLQSPGGVHGGGVSRPRV